MIVAARLRGPRAREVFSPGFLALAAVGHYPSWWRVDDLVYHTDHTGRRFVWRLVGPRRGTDWVLGVWPD